MRAKVLNLHSLALTMYVHARACMPMSGCIMPCKESFNGK